MVAVNSHVMIRNKLAFHVEDLSFETGGLLHGLIAVPMIVKRGFMHDQQVCPPRFRLPDHIRGGEHGDGDFFQFLFGIAGFDRIACHIVVACIVISPVVKLLHKIFYLHIHFSLRFGLKVKYKLLFSKCKCFCL